MAVNLSNVNFTRVLDSKVLADGALVEFGEVPPSEEYPNDTYYGVTIDGVLHDLYACATPKVSYKAARASFRRVEWVLRSFCAMLPRELRP